MTLTQPLDCENAVSHRTSQPDPLIDQLALALLLKGVVAMRECGVIFSTQQFNKGEHSFGAGCTMCTAIESPPEEVILRHAPLYAMSLTGCVSCVLSACILAVRWLASCEPCEPQVQSAQRQNRTFKSFTFLKELWTLSIPWSVSTELLFCPVVQECSPA